MNDNTEHRHSIQAGTASAVPATISPAVAATLFEHAPLGLAIVDGKSHALLYGNAYLGRIFEEMPATGTSLHLSDVFPPGLATILEAMVDEVLRHNQVITRKGLSINESAGNMRAWDVTVAPLNAGDATTPHAVLHLLDVTDALRGNASLGRIQEFDRIKEDFLAVTAHELRTPVTALLGYTNLMVSRAERGDWTDRDLHALRMIQAQARRLTQLINGLVDVARIQTGEVDLRYQQVDVTALVQRIVKELRLTAGDYTIEVDTPTAPVTIWGDAQRLEQVLSQLLDNALKFSPWGGIIQVHVWTDEQVHIAVVDQGIGIPKDELPQLFRRFYRASNTDTDRFSGLGIGLYLAREFIAAHHGRIDVRSIPKRETVFEITLPLYAEHQSLAG